MPEAQRHRLHADRFATLIDGVADWSVPTPVKEWTARDVVGHLIDWLPGFLAMGSDVVLPGGPAVADDPAGAWRVRSQAIQAILDDPATQAVVFRSQMVGDMPLAKAIDGFYTEDIFMHSWDLARATGQDDTLDAAKCAEMLAGMQQMSDVIRSSGQFGEQQPVADDAPVQDRLMAFLGRDPNWKP